VARARVPSKGYRPVFHQDRCFRCSTKERSSVRRIPAQDEPAGIIQLRIEPALDALTDWPSVGARPAECQIAPRFESRNFPVVTRAPGGEPGSRLSNIRRLKAVVGDVCQNPGLTALLRNAPFNRYHAARSDDRARSARINNGLYGPIRRRNKSWSCWAKDTLGVWIKKKENRIKKTRQHKRD
jgi:hypothetical protein